MIRHLLLTLAVLAFAACLTPAAGQGIPSAIDTFKVVDVTGEAGSIVPVKLLVKNDSATLMAMVAFFQIDTNVVKYVVDEGYVRMARVERGLTVDSVFNWSEQMIPKDSMRASLVLVGDGSRGKFYPEGRGVMVQFYVRIKDGVTNGTTTQIRLYHPADSPGQYEVCEYSDRYGSTSVMPTIVSGTLTVGTPTPTTNHPPHINAISTSTWNVQLGGTVTFPVSAYDDDDGQPITLRANGLPTGATFGTGGIVTGNGFASGTFTWSNISQPGTFVVTFSCVDDSNAYADPSRSVTINVGTPTPTEDILYTASSTTYKLIAGGIPGFSGVSIPVNLNNLSDAYGVQFDFLYNSSVLTIDSLIPTERLTDFTVYDNIGGSPGRVRVVAFGMNNQKISTGTTSGNAIFKFWGTIRSDAIAGEYPIDFENAWESINPNPAVASVKLKFDTTGVFVVDRFGDVNGDGRVDVADAVITVGYITSSFTLTTRQFNAADVDRSSAVDVIDLVAIINIIFGTTPPNSPQWTGDDAIVRLGDDDGIVSNGAINVNAELPTDIAGVQIELGYNPEKVQFQTPQTTEQSSSLLMNYRDDGNGKLIVVLYPRLAATSHIPAGAATMIRLPLISSGQLVDDGSDVRITSAVLSDPNAVGIPVKGMKPVLPRYFDLSQNYPNPFNPETTIEFAVGSGAANQQVRLVIYNLLGEKIATVIDDVLSAGHYAYKWRGTNDRGESVASGVYFYRLTVGEQSQTKKMVLLK